jgi:hypothetical protein
VFKVPGGVEGDVEVLRGQGQVGVVDEPVHHVLALLVRGVEANTGWKCNLL